MKRESMVRLALATLIAVSVAVPCFVGYVFAEGYQRNYRERAEFMRTNPCPATGKVEKKCPGYVVDHIMPLCLGGADRVANMQYQPTEVSRRKDKAELDLCRWVREAREAKP